MNYIIRIRQIVATYSRNDLNGLIICEKSADMKKKQVLKTPYRYLSLSRNYPKKSKHVDIWPVFFYIFPAAQNILSKYVRYTVFGGLGKSFGRTNKNFHMSRGGFRGGGDGGRADALSSGIRPPADPKVSPVDTF